MKSRETTRQINTSALTTERRSYSPPQFEPMEPRLLLSAGLLDMDIAQPLLTFNSGGEIAYNAQLDELTVDATPLSLVGGGPSYIITGDADFRIDALVDSDGDLTGGAAGDDLSVTGTIDFGGGPVTDVLLTGEIIAFGWLDTGITTNDKYDFKFEITGGILAQQYIDAGAEFLGVYMVSENSSFIGEFNTDFSGGAKGFLGAVPTPSPFLIDIETYVMATPVAEGFTPGYWKQPHHFDDWAVYSPDDMYEDVFGVDAQGDVTLAEALRAKGGKVYALERHSTAALLNAAHLGVDYMYSEAEVIAMTRDAFATGQYNTVKDLFEAQNEMGGDFAPGGGTSGFADGQDITFTYVVSLPVDLGPFQLDNIVVTDDNGTFDTSDDFNPAPVMEGGFNVGDLDADGFLDLGEEWVFTASGTATVGEHTNTALVEGSVFDESGTEFFGFGQDEFTYIVDPLPSIL